MCGIAGLTRAGPDGKVVVHRMVAALRHRGPDGTQVWQDGCVTLGHTRLKVLDLSEAGAQPMWTTGGRLGIVYNGEVYNFRELRNRLRDRGHRFHSATDTEVVLQAWAEWGPAALEHLHGIFAFAIWDRSARALYLARDRLGVKPLYWCATPTGAYLFASEVRALLASGLVAPKLDRSRLRSFLSQQTVPSPATLVDGVRMLAPGTWVSIDVSDVPTVGLRECRFWHLLHGAARGNGTERCNPEIARSALRSRLEAAVERQLVADVPLGVFLSGGLDSSAIAALMARVRKGPLRTFTVAFNEPGFDDGPFARLVARHLGTEHEEVCLADDDLLDRVPHALAAQDHPSGDGLNTWLVSEAAGAAGMTVALSGLGGDELFGGYPTFRRIHWIRRAAPVLRAMPGRARTAAGRALSAAARSVTGSKIGEILATDGSLPEVYPVLRSVFGPADLDRLLAITGAPQRPYAEDLRRTLRNYPAVLPLAAVSYAETDCYMHDVLLRDADQMSMAHALEIRVPLLDEEVVEFVMRQPDAIRAPSRPPKRFLAEAVGDLLPAELLARRKSGFALPMERWMRSPLRAFCERGLAVLEDHEAFRGREVRWGWQRFLQGHREVPWQRPWLLVTLGHWLEARGLT